MDPATRERLRKQAAREHRQALPALAGAGTPAGTPLPPPPQNHAATQSTTVVTLVNHVCGHTSPLAKFAARQCGKCLNEASQARAAAEKAARQARPADKAMGWGIPHNFQWPLGTDFHKHFDGQEWCCSVLVPPGADGMEFHAEEKGSNSFRVERALTLTYLAWIKERQQEEGHP